MKRESIFAQMNRYIDNQERLKRHCVKFHTKRWSKNCYRCRLAAIRMLTGLGVVWSVRVEERRKRIAVGQATR